MKEDQGKQETSYSSPQQPTSQRDQMMKDKETAGMRTESPAGGAESTGLRASKEDRENCHLVAW